METRANDRAGGAFSVNRQNAPSRLSSEWPKQPIRLVKESRETNPRQCRGGSRRKQSRCQAGGGVRWRGRTRGDADRPQLKSSRQTLPNKAVHQIRRSRRGDAVGRRSARKVGSAIKQWCRVVVIEQSVQERRSVTAPMNVPRISCRGRTRKVADGGTESPPGGLKWSS